ncbi:MAG TPA: serine/threonine-protein kinase [Gemmataceae bacterium]|nr:serine/threonine-protein kinase [Gemmataceae bacterium]
MLNDATKTQMSATCTHCGVELPPGTTHCTPCLIELGLQAGSQNADPGAKQKAFLFGDYEISADAPRLEGGMGIVYRARQMSLNRIVGLKMIRGGVLAGAGRGSRFRREAEAVARLDHPHIVPIYDIGEHDGRSFFTMKWMEGGSLADVLRRRRNVSGGNAQRTDGERDNAGSGYTPRRAAEVVVSVARAIHHAHQRGIIHRDLTPSNILLDAEGQPYVSDFGVAKRLDNEAPALTQSGAAVGTPGYMAPEQASGNTRDLTIGADIFSLGAVFYELLTGRPPFAGETPAATLQNVLVEEPKRPTAIASQIPKDLETICLKCLDKDPERRFGSAEALADDLNRWLRGEPILARPSGIWSRARKWARRNPAVASLSGFSCLVAVVAFAVVSWDLEKTRDTLRLNQELLRFVNLSSSMVESYADPETRQRIIDTEAARLAGEFATRPEFKAALLRALGAFYSNLGNLNDAERTLGEALEIRRGLPGNQDAEIAALLNGLGVIVHKNRTREGWRDAEPLHREAIDIGQRIYGPDSPELDEPRANLAFLLRRTSRYSEAKGLYAQLHSLAEARAGTNSVEAAKWACPLASVLLQENNWDAAEPLARHAWVVLSRHDTNDWRAFDAQSLLGGVYLGRKDYSNAEPLLLSGYEGMKQRVDITAFHARTEMAEAGWRLVCLYKAAGPTEKFDFWTREYVDVSNCVARANASAAQPKQP